MAWEPVPHTSFFRRMYDSVHVSPVPCFFFAVVDIDWIMTTHCCCLQYNKYIHVTTIIAVPMVASLCERCLRYSEVTYDVSLAGRRYQ